MPGIPTPRDLFGPRRPDLANTIQQLDFIRVRNSVIPSDGPVSVTDNDTHLPPFIARWREEIYRPERTYGSESYALVAGLSLLSLDEGDTLSWSKSGMVAPRGVRRGSPLPFRRVADTVWVPEGHPSTWEGVKCTSVDPEAFFPEGGQGSAEAQAACAHCPFTTECREWAITNDEAGFWGGMTETQRKRLAADRRARAARGIPSEAKP